MNSQQLLKKIDRIIGGIECDNFTVENLQALKAQITKEGLTS